MAQATFSVRMDEKLKTQFDELCKDFGMNMATAINIFAKAVVRERKIPFEISSPEPEPANVMGLAAFSALRQEAKAAGVQDLSLEEINAEIEKARNISGSIK